ncbi:hypothetical protein DL764_006242 [Monosporascus ibericus]|uniref:Branchpoint-bridging protein n=1 Tax=Monosporascus ibericus TaxID=155417 RepID=A0A4Q4T5A2_9PEZI|nr:hypothetical protein DL764_006242 [Monosporascus ibericus]
MTSEQIDAYVMQVRIEEITQKLRFDHVVPADLDRRSPSPPPRYDASGKRVNTRYRRCREHLEDERHSLVRLAAHAIPNYRAPQGYIRGPRRLITDRVYIPAKDFPEANFIGQLLGPRGRSIADMTAQSGATVAIRGKGSVKEGRGRVRDRPAWIDTNDKEGPLHCLITADTQDKVDKAKALVQAVIETAVTTPEPKNERKRQQLRDLAIANGNFRDDEGRYGIPGAWERSMSSGVSCHVCNNGGHVACDCPDKKANDVPWRSTVRLQTNAGQRTEDALDLAPSFYRSYELTCVSSELVNYACIGKGW